MQGNKNVMNERFYTVREVAQDGLLFEKVTEETVRNYCKTGRLVGINEGTERRAIWKIPASSIEKFFEDSKIRALNSRNRIGLKQPRKRKRGRPRKRPRL